MQPYMSCEPEDGPAIYDLYGVINHMGRLLGGHYTAYARTTAKQDSRQSEVGELISPELQNTFSGYS